MVSLYVGGKSHVSNGQSVSFKEPWSDLVDSPRASKKLPAPALPCPRLFEALGKASVLFPEASGRAEADPFVHFGVEMGQQDPSIRVLVTFCSPATQQVEKSCVF